MTVKVILICTAMSMIAVERRKINRTYNTNAMRFMAEKYVSYKLPSVVYSYTNTRKYVIVLKLNTLCTTIHITRLFY